MSEEAKFNISSPDDFDSFVTDEVVRMISEEANSDDDEAIIHVTVESRVWEEKDRDEGRLFEHIEDGRKLETYRTGDGDWAADLHHEYGCTRIGLHGDEDIVEKEVQRKIQEEEPNRNI